jgi:hypothetical protein
MTLDERMAYYNEKYGGSALAKEGAGKPAASGAKDAGNDRRRDRNRRRQAEPQGRNRGKKSGTGSTISGQNVSKKPDSAAGTKPPEPAKQGLFSKLAALFKGKKG